MKLFFLGIMVVVFISCVFMYAFVREAVCAYRNPYPLFHNGDKKIKELLTDKTKEYKTRSILKDINYDL